MDFSAFFNNIVQIFQLLTTSSSSALLSIFGFGLLLLAGVLAYWASRSTPDQFSPVMRAALFISLVAGILFSAAGPGIALLDAAQKTVTKMNVEQAITNLQKNAEVKYVVRLVSYDPNQEPGLAIDRLTNLGPPDQLYSFVASYDELVGYKVVDALDKVGQSHRDVKRVSAIIFPLHTPLYPANARGLLQVVQEVESRKTIQTQLTRKLLDGTSALSEREKEDLAAFDMSSYRVENFKDKYQDYCQLAREFNCSKDKDYSARAYVGTLYKDRHPLGFSQNNPAGDRCALPVATYCGFTDWEKAKAELQGGFGSRAFLIRNLEIKNIPGRIMVDFDNPATQIIPDIGTR